MATGRAAAQAYAESLPDEMWRDSGRSCAYDELVRGITSSLLTIEIDRRYRALCPEKWRQFWLGYRAEVARLQAERTPPPAAP